MPVEQLVCGARPIAAAVGLTPRRVYHLAASGVLPVFKIGSQLCASPTALREWHAAQLARAGQRVAA